MPPRDPSEHDRIDDADRIVRERLDEAAKLADIGEDVVPEMFDLHTVEIARGSDALHNPWTLAAAERIARLGRKTNVLLIIDEPQIAELERYGHSAALRELADEHRQMLDANR